MGFQSIGQTLTGYLGEGLALRPDAAIVAEDGGGRETLAIDLAHQMIVDVRLPRHPLSLPPPPLSLSPPFTPRREHAEMAPLLPGLLFIAWTRWSRRPKSRSVIP